MIKNITGIEVRKMYLDFFKAKGHQVEPSASLIPFEDPSLLWINSGVSTLKKYFDGRLLPENPRIVSAQKCIRTNDIENVGVTARHHTFFEMLGNFSIGDYFRKEAFAWGWELLTSPEWFDLDPNLLYITVYPDDQESHRTWKQLGVAPERIILRADNFWEIGEGPCGPCSEIYYDRGEQYDPHKLGVRLLEDDIENDRYIEIWNIVLSQFNSIKGRERSEYPELPNKNIDTGMGLERMVSVLQGGETNFDTDLFLPVIHDIEKLCKSKYRTGHTEVDTCFKVIADHVRSITFAIGDGALPANEGRGYVLRRLIRRSVRYAKKLQINRPFLYELVPAVVNIMGDFYPQILEQKTFIETVIKGEEERFHELLHDGLALLAEVITDQKMKRQPIINGKIAFRLYDTYGFPLELTVAYAQDEQITVDCAGFEAEMKEQRKRARAARKVVNSLQVQDSLLMSLKDESKFIGYDTLTAKSQIINIIDKNGCFVSELNEGEAGQIMLDQTSFYAESGGQVADVGTIFNELCSANVTNVQKAPNGQHLHIIKVTEGTLRVKDYVKAIVDGSLRHKIAQNHTATHLLQQALRDVLGQHVNQAGSSVTAERLRFDFTHFKAVSEQELMAIETLVNKQIAAALLVTITQKTLAEAKSIGARSLFGEKYGEVVRVVNISDYSIELCGGCHVKNCSELGAFKIISESGIGAGVRRIEATSGQNTYNFLNDQLVKAQQVAKRLKTTIDLLPSKLEQLISEHKELQHSHESLQAKIRQIESKVLASASVTYNDVSILIAKVTVNNINDLRNLIDELHQGLNKAVILLASNVNGKILFLCKVSPENVANGMHAGNIIQKVASFCSGKGGGKAEMAQGGGNDLGKLPDALHYAMEVIKEIINNY